MCKCLPALFCSVFVNDGAGFGFRKISSDGFRTRGGRSVPAEMDVEGSAEHFNQEIGQGAGDTCKLNREQMRFSRNIRTESAPQKKVRFVKRRGSQGTYLGF